MSQRTCEDDVCQIIFQTADQIAEEDFHIQPVDLELHNIFNRHYPMAPILCGAFRDHDAEMGATCIVLFFAFRGDGWKPFNTGEMVKFGLKMGILSDVRRVPKPPKPDIADLTRKHLYNVLCRNSWIVPVKIGDTNTYRVTRDFVNMIKLHLENNTEPEPA